MSSSFTVPPPALDVGSLERRPSIVLSASVPALLDASVYDPADSELVEESNRRYAADARPDRIRAAVSALTRVALGHSPSIRLVFGAHPTISPMILQAAADMDAMNESILVFQSEAYAGLIPQSTLRLANWSKGRLILTAKKPEPPLPATLLKRMWPYPASLAFMRELMMSVPGVVGAIFIGGMRGVEDEADLFRHVHPKGKRYAIASTGGAAALLDQRSPYDFHGTLVDPTPLRRLRSYTVVARRIVDDL